VSEAGEKFKPAPDAVTEFRSKLSKHGDLFVFDAFGCAHRAHSSVVGIAHEVFLNKNRNYNSDYGTKGFPTVWNLINDVDP